MDSSKLRLVQPFHQYSNNTHLKTWRRVIRNLKFPHKKICKDLRITLQQEDRFAKLEQHFNNNWSWQLTTPVTPRSKLERASLMNSAWSRTKSSNNRANSAKKARMSKHRRNQKNWNWRNCSRSNKQRLSKASKQPLALTRGSSTKRREESTARTDQFNLQRFKSSTELLWIPKTYRGKSHTSPQKVMKPSKQSVRQVWPSKQTATQPTTPQTSSTRKILRRMVNMDLNIIIPLKSLTDYNTIRPPHNTHMTIPTVKTMIQWFPRSLTRSKISLDHLLTRMSSSLRRMPWFLPNCPRLTRSSPEHTAAAMNHTAATMNNYNNLQKLDKIAKF